MEFLMSYRSFLVNIGFSNFPMGGGGIGGVYFFVPLLRDNLGLVLLVHILVYGF